MLRNSDTLGTGSIRLIDGSKSIPKANNHKVIWFQVFLDSQGGISLLHTEDEGLSVFSF